MWENTDQKNSEYEHFLRSGIFLKESNFNDRNDSQKAIVQKWSVEGSGKKLEISQENILMESFLVKMKVWTHKLFKNYSITGIFV